MYWALAIAALGFLIVVHEAGHFVVARWCSMRVDRFSVGFGPGILKKTSKKGTVFQLAPIPFGGFVEIRGMNIAEEADPTDAHAYPNRPAWQRFVTIFAGPATNYLSAIVLAFLLYTCHGVRAETYHVAETSPTFDAVGKIQPNDRILEVNGKPMYSPSSLALSKAVNEAPTDRIKLKLQRGKDIVEVEVRRMASELGTLRLRNLNDEMMAYVTSRIPPRATYGHNSDELVFLERHGAYPVTIEAVLSTLRRWAEKPVYRIGIVNNYDVVDIGIGAAAVRAIEFPIKQTKIILRGLRDIITGIERADPAGPVQILSEFEKAFSYAWVTGIELLMMLSVYLGLFNLFPLPALDGGRLVFLGYELVTRRRANPKIEAMVHMGGILVLGVLMILVTLNDCNVL